MLAALSLLGGCFAAAPRVPPAPAVARAVRCPAPETPVLPPLDADLPFDSPENVRALLERDDLLRRYLQGLRAALRCYEVQDKE